MSDKKMWFATQGYGQWIPCPSVGAEVSDGRFQQSASLINGGAWRRSSAGSSKSYTMSWSLTSRDNIRDITDFSDGVRGDGPFYWLDPFTMDKNVLPPSWATPMLAAKGAPSPVKTGGISSMFVPPLSTTATPANDFGYPAREATFLSTSSASARSVFIPVPPGFTAWVGVHGTGPGSQFRVQRVVNGGESGLPTPISNLPVTTSQRFSDSFDVTTANSGIRISPHYGPGVQIRYAGAMVQVLPTGVIPAAGGFISGQGNSGCEWDQLPTRTSYSAALDLVGLNATLVEVGDWL